MYRVMLVDDEYMILEGLKWIIPWQELGFEIVNTARSAQEALAYLADHEIDLLMTDITMPEMSGIELIATAQRRGGTFMSLILSGYQEFEYVKQGLELQVKNYLVKPVNREELLQSVKSIKEDLDAKKQSEVQNERYLEANLIRWLNDELNEQEYAELMQQYTGVREGDFTVVVVKGATPRLEAISQQLISQPLQIRSTMAQQRLTIIFKGSRQQVFIQLHEIERLLAGQGKIYLGETVPEWENIYESYEKVKQRRALEAFYKELLPQDQLQEARSSAEELTFLSFNKALMIGDRQTILDELAQIFDQLVQLQASPTYVRYVVFLLFADIYRQYPELSPAEYEEFVERIRQSDDLAELNQLLQALLADLKGQNAIQHYSDSVQQALTMIDQRYKEELNLKLVAEELHLHVAYFGQVFKKETQRSFSQVLNQVRTKQAQKLLLYTEKTISEIAEEVGFNNTNYFSKMFKKLNGITPKEFREQYKTGYAPVDGDE